MASKRAGPGYGRSCPSGVSQHGRKMWFFFYIDFCLIAFVSGNWVIERSLAWMFWWVDGGGLSMAANRDSMSNEGR